MDEFDAYWKESGRIEPRDSTVKEQMRIAFRAGSRSGRLADDMIAAEERAACTELVRAERCICARSDEREPNVWIEGFKPIEYVPAEADEPLLVQVHNQACPQALAIAIEARGRA